MEQSDRRCFGKKYCCNEWIVVRDSVLNSDLCAPVPFIKNKLRVLLLNHQASGDPLKWIPENSLKNLGGVYLVQDKLIN